MASNGAQTYNTAVIRQLLLAAFTPEEIRRFCYDQPDFRLVVRRFSPRHSLEEMVDELITYCDNFLLFPELLAELKQYNPRQYARFMGRELHDDKPATPAPELALRASDRATLTISHPISLQLVRVPTGEFLMGSVVARDKNAQDNELPPHAVHVPDFYIGKYPVTNLQYRTFVRATGYRVQNHWDERIKSGGKENHPVVYVTWHDALAFCIWLSREASQAFRLPTEAEWEKAARGVDGRIYPWGDEPPDERHCNFATKLRDTTTIGRCSPQGDSPYGCADMAGNVLEWCHSLYKPYPYQTNDGREQSEADGGRVLRGGSWASFESSVRCACRLWSPADDFSGNLGFRVARGSLG